MCLRRTAALQKYLLALQCNGVLMLVALTCDRKVCWGGVGGGGSLKHVEWSGSNVCPCALSGPLAVWLGLLWAGVQWKSACAGEDNFFSSYAGVSRVEQVSP